MLRPDHIPDLANQIARRFAHAMAKCDREHIAECDRLTREIDELARAAALRRDTVEPPRGGLSVCDNKRHTATGPALPVTAPADGG